MHIKRITLATDRFPTREHYPFNLEILQRTPELVFDAPVVCFVGENGSGKSTLLQAICRRCGIHIWEGPYSARVNNNPYEAVLHRTLDVEWNDGAVPGSFFGADIFHNFAQLVDKWAIEDPGQLDLFGGHSLLTQSHGQSLMSFFRSRYRIKGLYLLDEPETALSPRTQLELRELLHDMALAGHAQFIVATHSPILLAVPGAQILSFDRVPVSQIAYHETDHYKVYSDFMAAQSKPAGGQEGTGP